MKLSYDNIITVSFVGVSLIFCVRIFHKLRVKRCKCLPKEKKTVVITGATSGLGESCAIELAKRNCRLILGCRNRKMADKVVSKIKSSNKDADVFLISLDLSDLDSIKQFALDLHNEKIDVLINNAGVMAGHFRSIKSTNTEEDMAVNYLGHFYLTNLLLPNLSQSPSADRSPSRVIFISSSLSKNGRLAIENLDMSQDPYSAMQAYANSKLALNLFAWELHRRYHGSSQGGINVMTMFTNGMVNTRLSRHIISTYSVLLQPLMRLSLYLLLRDPSDVCQSIVHCAVSEDLHYSSNELFANFQSIPWPNNTLESRILSGELWDKSWQILGENTKGNS